MSLSLVLLYTITVCQFVNQRICYVTLCLHLHYVSNRLRSRLLSEHVDTLLFLPRMTDLIVVTIHSFKITVNEIKDALQASFYSFYCYYYHGAILAAIFGLINLLTC